MMVCTRCKKEKDEGEFSKNKRQCKQCQKEYKKEYRIENKNLIQEYRKEYNIKNKGRIIEYTKEYHATHKEYAKEYYVKNKELIKERVKEFYIRNKEPIKEHMKKYLKEYSKKRRKDDPEYRLACNTRARVSRSLRRWVEGEHPHTLSLIGCDWDKLGVHLESLFVEGMTWDNMGKGGWHIDHYVPINYFDLDSENKQRICFNYLNLRPLWEKENLSKHDSLPSDYLEHIQKIKDSLSL
jgi:hypothetical protein